MSSRARRYANSRPWSKPLPTEPAIPWDAIQADQQRQQTQPQQPQKGTTP